MPGFDDKNDSGNSAEYHTGERCATNGCKNPAGTAWGPYWCLEYNVEQVNRITALLQEMIEYAAKKGQGSNQK